MWQGYEPLFCQITFHLDWTCGSKYANLVRVKQAYSQALCKILQGSSWSSGKEFNTPVFRHLYFYLGIYNVSLPYWPESTKKKASLKPIFASFKYLLHEFCWIDFMNVLQLLEAALHVQCVLKCAIYQCDYWKKKMRAAEKQSETINVALLLEWQHRSPLITKGQNKWDKHYAIEVSSLVTNSAYYFFEAYKLTISAQYHCWSTLGI